jgi:hypothetical protein
MMLAVDLARIFDDSAGRSKDDQDKASIPILAHHLGRADVRAHLEQRAKDCVAWLADVNVSACGAAIDEAVAEYEALRADVNGQAALSRLRELRTQRLAHNLYDKEPSRPMYADLFMLADFARGFVGRVSLAAMAAERDMSCREGDVSEAARAFWAAALRGNLLGPLPSNP